MPITKTGTILIKLAMPRWRAIFQLLGNISQHAIQQGKRPPAWVKQFPHRRELPSKMREHLNELREKHGPKNGIGVTSTTYSSDPPPLKLMKSQRSKLLGLQRGNQNMREQMGYSRVNPANIPDNDLNAHMGQILQSIGQSRKQDFVRWTRDREVGRNLGMFKKKYGNMRPNPARNPSDIVNVGADPRHKLLYIKDYTLPKELKLPSPFTPDGKPFVLRPSGSLGKAKNRRMLDAFMERHELYEAQAWEKALGRSIMNGGSGTMREAKSFLKYPGKLKSAHSGNEYTNHADMNVLVKERRDLDTFTHTSNPAYKFVRKVRDAVERPYMDAAGGFDPAKAVQPHKPIDVFKNHESQFFRNTKKPVPVGNDLILPAK